MERNDFTAEKREALESLRQPFAVFGFKNDSPEAILVSDGLCALLGCADRPAAIRALGGRLYADAHPDDAARVAEAAARFLRGGGVYEVVYRARRRGSRDWAVIHARGEMIPAASGGMLAEVTYTDEGTFVENSAGTGFNITETLSNALREQSIVRASRYDFLTGLPSMTHFFELAETAKNAMLERGQRPAVMYVDFSGMKFFNAKHGFAAGDAILRDFAMLLAVAFGSENCCRIGADHFAAVAAGEGLEDALTRIFTEFREKHDEKTPPVHVGIYSFAIEDVHVAAACDRAKLACGALGNSYSSRFIYYSPEQREDAVMKRYIIENFDTALREKWIKVYLQPIVRSVNGKICDVEALARWINPEKGVLPPASFIPVLEEAGLICRLDLYMVDEVLASIKMQEAEGFSVVPHSINLSRSDFDACDVVEEIRRRVDGAGVARDRITIEITESVIGGNFEFMKAQVVRFRALGFPVWLDDFGSGYSSLDVLQSIKFNLIKFDMSFMRKLDESEDGKVVLTELMRMATALGVDTVCEGVETEAQVRFLQEIGCSKLQGYYYSMPLPFDDILAKRGSGTLIATENPGEADYYESIGRVNLYDLSVIAQGDEYSLQNTFDTLPMGIIEIKGDEGRFVRFNQSYRDFMKRFFDVDLSQLGTAYGKYDDAFMKNVVVTCCENGLRSFYDEKMPDGSVVHSFARRLSTNPLTGSDAVLVAVLSVSDAGQGTSYAEIARALAADYYNIYVIDLETNGYVEYSSLVGGEELALERHGTDFFASAVRDAMTRVYEADRREFISRFTLENVLRELDAQGLFTMTFRLDRSGVPVYVNMKITRMQGGSRLIIGISNVDAQMKKQEEEETLRKEKTALGRIAALGREYIVLYTVDPVTNHYVQYSPTKEFSQFGLAAQGEDFFRDAVLDAPKAIDPRDLGRHLRVMTKENMLRAIRKSGVFIHNYRLLINGSPKPASLRATLAPEEDGEKIILGVTLAEEEDMPFGDGRSAVLAGTRCLSFTKDAVTGRYLTANRAFAEYVGKKNPEEVVGLTADGLFGPEAAVRFAENDARAGVMSEPLVTLDELPDASGALRQFRTMRTSFTGGDGRRCLMVLCQEVTDMLRARRENASARKALDEARDSEVIYTHIAQALARGITDLYYVNIETDELIEYHTDDSVGVLTEARRGSDFFEGCRRDVKLFVHPEDEEKFVNAMDRDFLAKTLAGGGVFELIYRRIKGGASFYVRMKVTRVEEDPRYIVIAVSDVDELMRKRLAEQRMLEERVIYARLHALTGKFICVYVVDPETGDYREFTSTDDYEKSFAQAKEGHDFFGTVRKSATQFNHPDDLDRFLKGFTRENVMSEVEKNGSFTMGYRLMMGGRPLHVQMKAAMVEEKEGPRLIVGLNDIDAQVRQEEDFGRRLAQAQAAAHVDALTGVGNKHAYLEAETRMDRLIAERREGPFAIVMLDVNDLKKVNDTMGHQAGDQYLRDAGAVISGVFRNSAVFRVGGDEFAVIVSSADYYNVDALVAKMREHNERALREGGVIIACGSARFENDPCVASVFERADHSMYADKNELKSLLEN